MTTQTIGQKRVRLSSFPVKQDIVDIINTKTAELIDLIETLKSDKKSQMTGAGMDNAEIGELVRECAVAQTEYESAAHWAVKAANYPIPTADPKTNKYPS